MGRAFKTRSAIVSRQALLFRKEADMKEQSFRKYRKICRKTLERSREKIADLDSDFEVHFPDFKNPVQNRKTVWRNFLSQFSEYDDIERFSFW